MIRSTSAIAVLLVLCIACNSNNEAMQAADSKLESLNRKAVKETTDDTENGNVANGFQLADTVASPPQDGQEKEGQKKQQALLPQKPIDWDKKIIKTATLDAEVKDYKEFSKNLSEKVKKYGGYISSEEQTQSDYELENNVVIRVPVDQFENAVNDLLSDAVKINEKKVSSDDVTTELIDGKSRLEAKKQVRLRYLDLLKQAKNMEEILTVQKEINAIQEEIETVAGRINYLGNSSAMSTIQLSFSQILDPSAKTARPEDAGFATKVKNAFLNGWNWIGEVFVGVLSIWPFILLLVGGWIFLVRRRVPKTK